MDAANNVQIDKSETADRGLDNKETRFPEPPTPWSHSSADVRRSSSDRGVYMIVGATNDNVQAAPPPYPGKAGKRSKVTDGQFNKPLPVFYIWSVCSSIVVLSTHV